MDSCKFLTYITIALIFALSIHLISKTLLPSQENMSNTYSKCSMNNKFNFKKYNNQLYSNKRKISQEIEGVIEGMDDLNYFELSKDNNINKDCTVCDTSEKVDDYIRESLLQKSSVCKEKKEYSNNEINKHRDQYIAFRNGILQSTNTVDTVDKINDLYLSGSTDISRNHHDVKIKDLYDHLTNSRNIYNENCNKKLIDDNIMNQSNYLINGARGKAYTKDNWMYEHESVMNGGEFMNNILPYDNDKQQPMAL